MKKIFTILAVTFLLGACASTGGVTVKKNIDMLSKKEVYSMSTSEVLSYYQAANEELLTSLVYNYGGSTYDPLTTTFNNMNKELEAMTHMKISKETYYQKLRSIVAKHRAQIKRIVEKNDIGRDI